MLDCLLFVLNRGDIQRIFRKNVLVTHCLDPIEHFLALLHDSCHSSFLPKVLESHSNFLITAQTALNSSSWHFLQGDFLLQSMLSLFLTNEFVLFYDTDQLLNNFIHLVKLLSIVGAAQRTPISHLCFVQTFHAAQAKGVPAFKIDRVDHQLQTDGTREFLRIKAGLKPSPMHFLVLMPVDHLLLLIHLTQKRSKFILGDSLQSSLVDLLPCRLFRPLNNIVSITDVVPSPWPHYNLHFLLINYTSQEVV